jgi:hypothetical protein
MTSIIATLESKLAAGRRLTREDGLALFESPDLLVVAAMADRVRQARHGRRAYYCINTHVNYTNRCENECPLCAFWAEADGPDDILRGGSPDPPRKTRDRTPAEEPRGGGAAPPPPPRSRQRASQVRHEAISRAPVVGPATRRSVRPRGSPLPCA